MKNKKLDAETLLEMYKRMWQIRRFEEEAGNLYKQGVIKGGIHASIGQEAVSTGVAVVFEIDEEMITRSSLYYDYEQLFN